LVLRGKRLVRSPLVILLLISTLLSVIFTPTSQSINELVRLFAGVAFVFTAGVLIDKQYKIDRFARYLLLAVMVPIVLSFAQHAGILPYEYWDYLAGVAVGRVSGTYQHPLGLIFFLIYAVPLALYLLARPAQSVLARLALWSFIGISLVALVFTYHRTALIAVGLQIWLWLILTRKYRIAILFVVGAALLIFWRRADLQILYVNVLDILQGRVGFSTRQFLRGRGTHWYLFLHSLFSAHPFYWLVGRGGSMAEGFVPDYGYWSSDEPHSDYIRLLHAYGLVGLGLYLGILGSFLRQSLRLRRARAFFPRHLGSLMIVVLICIAIMSITTEPIRFPTGMWYLFVLGSVVQVQSQRLGNASRAIGDEENRHGSQEFLQQPMEHQERNCVSVDHPARLGPSLCAGSDLRSNG
jgi:O-antigen ligase